MPMPQMYHFRIALDVASPDKAKYENLISMLRKDEALNSFFEFSVKKYDKDKGKTIFVAKVKSDNPEISGEVLQNHVAELMHKLSSDYGINTAKFYTQNNKSTEKSRQIAEQDFSDLSHATVAIAQNAVLSPEAKLKKMKHLLPPDLNINLFLELDTLQNDEHSHNFQAILSEEVKATQEEHEHLKKSEEKQQQLTSKIKSIREKLNQKERVASVGSEASQNWVLATANKEIKTTPVRKQKQFQVRGTKAFMEYKQRVIAAAMVLKINSINRPALKASIAKHRALGLLAGTDKKTQLSFDEAFYSENINDVIKAAQKKYKELLPNATQMQESIDTIDRLNHHINSRNKPMIDASNIDLEQELENVMLALTMQDAFISQHKKETSDTLIIEADKEVALIGDQANEEQNSTPNTIEDNNPTNIDEQFQMHHFRLETIVTPDSWNAANKEGVEQVVAKLKEKMQHSLFSFEVKKHSTAKSSEDPFYFVIKVKGTPPALGIGKETPIAKLSFNQFKSELKQVFEICRAYGVNIKPLEAKPGKNEKHITKDNADKLIKATTEIKRALLPKDALSHLAVVLNSEKLDAVTAMLPKDNALSQIALLKNNLDDTVDTLKKERDSLKSEAQSINTAIDNKGALEAKIKAIKQQISDISISNINKEAMSQVHMIANSPLKSKRATGITTQRYNLSLQSDYPFISQYKKHSQSLSSEHSITQFKNQVSNQGPKTEHAFSGSRLMELAMRIFSNYLQPAIEETQKNLKNATTSYEEALALFYEINGNNPETPYEIGLKREINGQPNIEMLHLENEVLTEELSNLQQAFQLAQGLELNSRVPTSQTMVPPPPKSAPPPVPSTNSITVGKHRNSMFGLANINDTQQEVETEEKELIVN